VSLNTSGQQEIEYRMERVAALRVRGLTQRAIVMHLAEEGIANPKTGKSYSLGTVNSDIAALEEQWHREAMVDTGVMKGRILAQLSEVLRKAWADENLTIILRTLKQEADLFGLQGPGQPKAAASHTESPHVPLERTSAGLGTLGDLLQKALAHGDPAQLSAILDEYQDLRERGEALILKLQTVAGGPELLSQQTEHEPPPDTQN
jgi:hypothetical protein